MRIIRILLAAVVGCLLLAAVYLSNLISQGHFALEQAGRYNIVWAINQALVELTRLEQNIAQSSLTGKAADKDEAYLRYQILLGRADILRRGDSAEFIRKNDEYLKILQNFEEALIAAGPVLERLDQPGAALELDRILSPLDTQLAHLASAARQFGDELNALDQMRLRRLHFLYTGVAAGLIFCGLALIALLSWNNRLLGRAHKELRTLADELESVSDALRLQNERFQAALKNMTHGLCMFDKSGQMVVSNDRFRQMFSSPDESDAQAGLPDDFVARIRAQAPSLARRQTSASGHTSHHTGVGDARSSSFVQEHLDGRFLSVQHVTLADGGWLATFEDITDRRLAELQIVRMAHHDSLTGLANRVLFHDLLQQAFSEANEKNSQLAMLFIDVDNFKDVNDTLGHQFGDAVLKAIAARLRSCMREEDLIARLGGDEFGIILPPSYAESDYAAIASRLIETVSEPYMIDGYEVLVGISIGIAISGDASFGPEEILRHADLALYDAKVGGKGAFRFFKPEMDEQLQDRKRLETDLRKALSNGEMTVFYQPAIDTRRGKVIGFEALARWHHPVRGMVPPTEFIPIAEEAGLIGPIGEWVLLQACAEAASWPPDIRVAVNISPNQFRDQELAEKISEMLESCGLPASRLELEITETLLLEHNDRNLSVLHDLRKQGVRVAMDDFGTGYSSLIYLLGFPFDKIKIDRSFVQGISDDRNSRSIVQLISDLGNRLGMTTVAEGVETEEQYAHIESSGCAVMQGFFFAEPMPASQVQRFIRDWKPGDTRGQSARGGAVTVAG